MKKRFLIFAMLASMVANAAVKVTPLSANYATQVVTFKVEWTTAPYNNRVWVWVDFCPVAGTTPTTSFSTATISNPTKIGGNGTITGSTARGFFIEYANATNAGTTVTAKLSNATGKFNWCAYGSDYPPNATVNAGGGYTLRGTKPFTINGSQTVDANTFGAGICITTIADLTGRPDGFATPTLTITTTSPAARCGAGAVTLSATAAGGTTNAMTYTWNIGGTNYTNNTNSYTTASLSASATYTVKVKNANNCESNTASGNITVNYPGNNNQAAHATCGCATGTTNCSGTCKTNSTYTTNDGACTGACHTAYVQSRNQCGLLLSTRYGTYTNNNCESGCSAIENSACATGTPYLSSDINKEGCRNRCTAAGYRYYYGIRIDLNNYDCYCCN